jgi:thymidine kinase
MVSHLKNWQILGSVVLIFLAGFGTYKAIDEIAKRNSSSVPSNVIPNSIPNADTNRKTNTKRYENIISDTTTLNKKVDTPNGVKE